MFLIIAERAISPDDQSYEEITDEAKIEEIIKFAQDNREYKMSFGPTLSQANQTDKQGLKD